LCTCHVNDNVLSHLNVRSIESAITHARAFTYTRTSALSGRIYSQRYALLMRLSSILERLAPFSDWFQDFATILGLIWLIGFCFVFRGVARNLLRGTNRIWETEVSSGVQGQNMETPENTNGAVTTIDLHAPIFPLLATPLFVLSFYHFIFLFWFMCWTKVTWSAFQLRAIFFFFKNSSKWYLHHFPRCSVYRFTPTSDIPSRSMNQTMKTLGPVSPLPGRMWRVPLLYCSPGPIFKDS